MRFSFSYSKNMIDTIYHILYTIYSILYIIYYTLYIIYYILYMYYILYSIYIYTILLYIYYIYTLEEGPPLGDLNTVFNTSALSLMRRSIFWPDMFATHFGVYAIPGPRFAQILTSWFPFGSNLDDFGDISGPLWRLGGPLGPHYAKVGTMGWIPEAVSGQMGPKLDSKWS